MFWEAFVLMTTLHRRLADSATVSAALPTAPPDGQVSRASKDLEGSRFFTSAAGTAISPNNFRTKVWLPAPETAKIHGTVTFRDLRGARVVAAHRRRRVRWTDWHINAGQRLTPRSTRGSAEVARRCRAHAWPSGRPTNRQ